MIFRIAYRVLRNREDAEDAVQQAFALAFVHLHKFQGQSRFSTRLGSHGLDLAAPSSYPRDTTVTVPPQQATLGPSSNCAPSAFKPNPLIQCQRSALDLWSTIGACLIPILGSMIPIMGIIVNAGNNPHWLAG
jgi:RNA polymerase sigma-70 factor, ECF subfamily